MIYSLQGVVAEKSSNDIVLLCGGIGFQVTVPLATAATAPEIGSPYTLYTYFHVKEDSMELYGFAGTEGRKIFKMLLTVSGVGPKAAMSILSTMSEEQILIAISAGDYKAFTKSPGIGPKTAQRLILELKDKVGALTDSFSAVEVGGVAVATTTGVASQAIEALVSLGYSRSEAATAVAKLNSSLPLEELIKQALRAITDRR